MRKILILLFSAIVVAVFLVARASATRSVTPTLVGTDGPGYTINLKLNNKAVKTLKAGTYKVVIHDKATIHGWSLDGPHGFAKDISAVPFVGTKTVTLKLKAGKYKFYCPNHESVMFGHFTVK
jgi:plastocyanin